MVNSMSALVSALTILVLFWSLTHMARRIILKEGKRELTLARLMQVEAALLAEIENAREQVRALSTDELARQYQGAELGERIRAAQVENLSG
ncbi:MAG: protein O-mannosyl-transferase family, partial [Cardiobacterium sp.]